MRIGLVMHDEDTPCTKSKFTNSFERMGRSLEELRDQCDVNHETVNLMKAH